jgi:hypothetical protein
VDQKKRACLEKDVAASDPVINSDIHQELVLVFLLRFGDLVFTLFKVLITELGYFFVEVDEIVTQFLLIPEVLEA